jgi:hypothetical protein
VIYRDATNTWSEGPLPPGLSPTGSVSHAYDHNTVDPVTGYTYARPRYWAKQVCLYNPSSNAWSNLPESPQRPGNDIGWACCGALSYFPEMGGLLFLDYNHLYFYNKSNNQWSELPSSPLSMDSRGTFAEYSAPAKVVLFSGGGTNIYKIDGAGKITALTDAPFSPNEVNSCVTVDPVTGKFLVLNKSNGNFYEFDALTDNWQTLSGAPSQVQGETVAAPVSTYGVVMFVKSYYDNSHVTIYKHTSGTGLDLVRKKHKKISIFPSPLTQRGIIRLDGIDVGAGFVEIVDVNGRLIQTFKAQKRILWNGKRIAQGMYLVRYLVDNVLISQERIVVIN